MNRTIIGILVYMLLITSGALLVFEKTLQKAEILIANNGNILYVGGTGAGNYTAIQAAINDANPGGTVFVYDYSAPYYENIQIGKPINLIGENKETTIIDGQKISEVVKVSGECNIYGFTVINGTYGFLMDYKSANSTIHDNIVSNNDYWSVNIQETLSLEPSRIAIKRNTFKDNGIGPKNISNGGIMLSFCSSITINNNFINNNWNAFFFKSIFSSWLYNYWDRPRILPYPIFGLQAILPPIFWLKFDRRPWLTQYGGSTGIENTYSDIHHNDLAEQLRAVQEFIKENLGNSQIIDI